MPMTCKTWIWPKFCFWCGKSQEDGVIRGNEAAICYECLKKVKDELSNS